MDTPKEIDSETLRRVMGHIGSIKTSKKAKASAMNLDNYREQQRAKKAAMAFVPTLPEEEK